MTPTQRTLKAIRDRGYICDIVERWIQYGKNDNRRGVRPGFRKDLFGIIDIIAIDPARGILGVQSTGSAFAAHLDKLTVDMAHSTLAWLDAGGHLELWGWRKVKKVRGGKQMVWEPRVKVITAFDVLGI